MTNTTIIIPSRLSAKRLPNKPLRKINDISMIVHVMNKAKESNVGEVYVATPDQEIVKTVTKNRGQAILTNSNHLSGSDRVYEAYNKKFKQGIEIIINLQGDMPNIKPDSICKLEKLMKTNTCDIGTLAAPFKNRNEIDNPNIVKVVVEKDLNDDNFLEAKDFFRHKNISNNEKIYHHIGIYAFRASSLAKYVKMPRSAKEIERNLEQMRAMENNLVIKVGLSKSIPLSVDTEEDLKKINEEMR